MRVLLEHGANVDAVNRQEETALHCAARYGHFSTVELLLERGAQRDLADRRGRTAADVAAPSVVRSLRVDNH